MAMEATTAETLQDVLLAGRYRITGRAVAGGMATVRVTAEHEIVGTLDYIAPERLSGDAVGEAPSDIYSLAVLAFEMLSGGRRPWPSADPRVHLQRSAAAPPNLRDRWPEAPPAVAAV